MRKYDEWKLSDQEESLVEVHKKKRTSTDVDVRKRIELEDQRK